MTEPRDRAPFSAIVDRPPFCLPGGARVAVWTIVNLEVWDIGRTMARQAVPAPAGQVLLPDVPNWSWHVQHHEWPYWAQRCRGTVDRYYDRGAERAKIMAIAIHPYVSGQPHRIGYLEQVYDYIGQHDDVVFMNGGELFDWHMRNPS